MGSILFFSVKTSKVDLAIWIFLIAWIIRNPKAPNVQTAHKSASNRRSKLWIWLLTATREPWNKTNSQRTMRRGKLALLTNKWRNQRKFRWIPAPTPRQSSSRRGGRGKSSCGRRGLASRVPSAAVRLPASPDEARPIAAAAEQERVRSPTWSPGRRFCRPACAAPAPSPLEWENRWIWDFFLCLSRKWVPRADSHRWPTANQTRWRGGTGPRENWAGYAVYGSHLICLVRPTSSIKTGLGTRTLLSAIC